MKCGGWKRDKHEQGPMIPMYENSLRKTFVLHTTKLNTYLLYLSIA